MKLNENRYEKKLTVTITFYNQRKYVEKAVESVLNQKLDYDYEILIGDDGSNDGTYELLQERYGENEHICIYRMPRENNEEFSNWRHSRLILFLLEKAKGEYIAILDGDDYYCSRDGFSKKIELLDKKENKDCIMCASDTCMKDLDGTEIIFRPKDIHKNKIKKSHIMFSDRGLYFPIAVCVFRSSVLDKIDYESLCDHFADQVILDFVLSYGKLYYINGVDFVYRKVKNGICSSADETLQAIRGIIGQEVLIQNRKDYYWRRLWKVRKKIIFVYENSFSILEEWGGGNYGENLRLNTMRIYY